MPATFFITTQPLRDQIPFWWDEMEALLFGEPSLPNYFSQTIAGLQLTFELGDEARLTPQLEKKHNRWIWPQKPPTKRLKLYLRLWEVLKPLRQEALAIELDKIKAWAGVKTAAETVSLPMNTKELQTLSGSPLFNIGIHTLTHPALSFHSYEIQTKEIHEGKSQLEALCNQPANSMAFPYGDYNADTLEIVRKQALSISFSTKELSATNQSNRFHVGRCKVKNWDSPLFEKQLLHWFKYA
jgi:peptidoglycan/xylan/chitin deacetylase (PgdA/CDA1 family)